MEGRLVVEGTPSYHLVEEGSHHDCFHHVLHGRVLVLLCVLQCGFVEFVGVGLELVG